MRRRDLFLDILEQVRAKYDFVVAGYVVMPEHFHLLIGGTAREKAVYGDAGAEATRLPAVSRNKEKEHGPDVALARSCPAGLLAAQEL